MHAAVDLALGGLRIDDQAAILHRHEAIHLDDAGLGIHGNVGHLNAGNTERIQTARAGSPVLAHLGNLAGSELVAGRLPGKTLGGIALDLNPPVHRFQLARLDAQATERPPQTASPARW